MKQPQVAYVNDWVESVEIVFTDNSRLEMTRAQYDAIVTHDWED